MAAGRWNNVMSASGLPSMTTHSASLPGVSVPSSRSTPRISAEPAFDRALREGRAALSRADRGVAYRRAQALLVRDMPRFHFVQHGSHLAHRTEFTGWSWDDGVRGTVPFWSLEHVRLVTERR